MAVFMWNSVSRLQALPLIVSIRAKRYYSIQFFRAALQAVKLDFSILKLGYDAYMHKQKTGYLQNLIIINQNT